MSLSVVEDHKGHICNNKDINYVLNIGEMVLISVGNTVYLDTIKAHSLKLSIWEKKAHVGQMPLLSIGYKVKLFVQYDIPCAEINIVHCF
jgi:hypothetical protein